MRIPKYRPHSTGQAFVEVKGERIYLGRYGTPESRRRWRAIVDELLEEAGAADGEQDFSKVRIVEELALAYLRDRRAARDSHLPQIKTACTVLGQTCPDVPVRDFRPKDFKKVRAAMVKKGWARRYVNTQCQRVIQAFRWAVEQGICRSTVPSDLREVAPLRAGQSAARETEPVKPVPQAVVEATLPHLGSQVAAMVKLQLYSGMRAGDVVLMRPCDVDRSDKAVWVYTPATHKGTWRELDHVAYLGPKAQAVLKPFLAREATAYCFSPAEATADRHARLRKTRKTRVQPSQANRAKRSPLRAPRQRYDTHSYSKAIGYAVAKANRKRKPKDQLPRWTALQLRHEAGTQIRKRFGLEAAQVMLGHAEAKTTEIYAERDASLGKRVAKEFG